MPELSTLPTLVFYAAEEVETAAAYVAALRAQGREAYLRDASALVYAAEGAGLMQAGTVWATSAALEQVQRYYPGALAMPAAPAPIPSRGGEPGLAGSGASAPATDGPSRETPAPVTEGPGEPPRKRARARPER